MSGKDVLDTVRQTIERYDLLKPGCKVVVAVSGGPDSLCLLHVLRELRQAYGVQLHAAHLNHCLRGQDSAKDSQFVRQIAADWGLPLTRSSVNVKKLVEEQKGSVEEMARRVRYRFLASTATQVGADRIAVGHNADDQTETVLMHWLRGAGLAGLRGMRPRSFLGELRLGEDAGIPAGLLLIRPLLYVTRAEIEAYCEAHGLQPRFDRSNLDTTYFRNRLRHELLPYLERYNPNIRELIRRSAEVVSGDYDVIRSALDRAWAEIVRSQGDGWITFDLDRWRALDVGLQRSTVRMAIQTLRRCLRDIGWEHVENAVLIGRDRETGAQATLPDGLMLTVGYDELILSDAGTEPDAVPPFPWFAPSEGERIEARLPGATSLGRSGWSVKATFGEATPEWIEKVEANRDQYQAFVDADKVPHLAFRRRQPGDRIYPLGLGGKSKLLREFLVNLKVPARWRDLVPVAVCDGQIVWLAGWRLDERFKVGAGTRRILHLVLAKEM